jgi:hypothetical protein
LRPEKNIYCEAAVCEVNTDNSGAWLVDQSGQRNLKKKIELGLWDFFNLHFGQ